MGQEDQTEFSEQEGAATAQTDEVMQAFPPEVSVVVTEVEARVVPFKFVGGKAVDLTLLSGPLRIHAHFPPDAGQAIIDAIAEKIREAKTDVMPANWSDVEKVKQAAAQNGAGG